jgi:opacity protein-like surface antigen
MRNVVLAAGLLVFLPLSLLAQAQDPYPAPKAEVFAGYSLLHIDGSDANGWNFALAGNVNNNVGIVADVSGNYNRQTAITGAGTSKSKLNFHSFLAGPQITERRYKWISPFTHALFGFSRVNGSLGQSIAGAPSTASKNDVSGFAMALGGGLDITADDRIFIRLIQADYFLVRADKIKHEGARISAGIVFRFGKRETY